MDIGDIGRVYHYLLKYRSVESKPIQRRSRDGESVIASILRSASADQLDQLNEFLAPQGFKVIEFDDTTRGVPVAGRVWVLARSEDAPASSFMSTERVFSEMNVRGNGTQEESAVWFLHIWLIYLSLVYTRAGRGVSEVSSYVDATFSREALEEAVQDHISHIRQMGVSEAAGSKVIEILDSEKGKDVPRRISAYMKLMCAAGLVCEIDKNEYQQTLLGAYEIAQNYDSSLRIPIDNTLGSLVNIVAPGVDDNEVEDAELWA
ncbi:hypothetical protein [Microbulbifer epialgicus]|uniref:MAGE domain-containing protein n=1 Tax=Microbulbifer epialgicus TaxID=393907 RepID=A0ABV4P4M6_9GAMM